MPKGRNIKYFMTPDPVTMDGAMKLVDAARAMRDNDIGDVIVTKNNRVFGMLTDRDIVIRGVADGYIAQSTSIEEICTSNISALSPADTDEDALLIMQKSAVRRVPVVENGRAVGIVSLGDLAVERDPDSALGSISARPPNS